MVTQPPTLLLLFGAPAALGFVSPIPLSRRDRPAIHGDQWQPLIRSPPGTPVIFHPLGRQDIRLCETGSSSDDGTEIHLSALRRNACVAVLLALFTVNQWSRSLVFYIVDFSDKAQVSADALAEASRLFINVDLGFDQAQYGLLASLGFATLFSLTSLLAGRAVDQLDSRWLLAGSGAVWALAMEWQAVATRFDDVLGARLLQGFSQAFCNPAAYVALGKITPTESRATVFGVYSSGIYFGGALAALSILIDASLGWRGLSEVTCVVGLAVALLTGLVLPPLPPLRAADAPQDSQRELVAGAGAAEPDGPRYSATSDQPEWASLAKGAGTPVRVATDASFSSSVGDLLESGAVRWILIGSTFRFMAGFAVGVWIVPFYRAAFPNEIGTEFALLKASVNGVAGAASALGGGALVDRLVATEPRARQWVPAAGSMLAIPFWLATLYAPTLQLSLTALFMEYLVAECWFGPTIAALQSAAPARLQGLSQGIFNTLTLAGNFAPLGIGLLLNDYGYELAPTLAVLVPLFYASSAAAFVVAGEKANGKTVAEGERARR